MNSTHWLVVDLDGTLIRTDMLFETFWLRSSQDWTTPFRLLPDLLKGRAALKDRLAGQVEVDPAALPYNPEVIELLERWRAAGGRTALVTASSQRIADRIAAHLGLFDEVHGSSAVENLKGPRKAAFLDRHFGQGGYAYVGDSRADLGVWPSATAIYTVDSRPSVRRAAEDIAARNQVEIRHLGAPRGSLRAWMKLLRPHQWLKNILIFVTLLIAHQFEWHAFGLALLAFISFCLVASSAYINNDLLDLAADRVHPRKRKRPLASGAVPIELGTVVWPLLLLAGVGFALLVGVKFFAVMAVYYVTTTAYSLRLKRFMVIDIFVLSLLYTLRILAGAVAIGVMPSIWLMAFSMFFFFSLAAVKRQAELVDAIKTNRSEVAGRGYLVEDMPIISMMGLASGYVSVLVMVLYTNSPEVRALYASPRILWGISGVLLCWITYMVMKTNRGEMHDDPVIFATRDTMSRIGGLLVVCLCVLAGVNW
ncbi:UbiA family prenyltransferase [Paenirhodobacter populi]|uniref:UbiA family prenyltransferase n=1 Tax=Paenirhodobacter populi TaxID=2306993 RepID=A0A443JBA1_9RHOB|nr:UbiA family prenyltransferase [Sinirhodobacter populi]RWR17836.1 UbiA family prenyltransferase [Sinirhodobacter populi]